MGCGCCGVRFHSKISVLKFFFLKVGRSSGSIYLNTCKQNQTWQEGLINGAPRTPLTTIRPATARHPDIGLKVLVTYL